MLDFDWRWLIGLAMAGPMAWEHQRINRLEDRLESKADKADIADMRDDVQYIRQRLDALYEKVD